MSETEMEETLGRKQDYSLIIRPAACEEEIHEAHRIEMQCYLVETAGSLDAFIERFRQEPKYFLLAYEGERMVGILNGIRLQQPDLADESLKKVKGVAHNGRHFCVLSVAVPSEHRRQGVGSRLVQALIKQAAADRLKSIELMCEYHYIPFYKQLGFIYKQLSASQHGGIQWHEMTLELETTGPGIDS